MELLSFTGLTEDQRVWLQQYYRRHGNQPERSIPELDLRKLALRG